MISSSSAPGIVRKRLIRIATVCKRDTCDDLVPYHISHTRWLRISEALARLGYHVDMIVNTPAGVVQKAPRLRFVPFAAARWHEYDVVKTEYQRGFDALCSTNGGLHPFIISRLGSVVGRDDSTKGVHFSGQERELLFRIQERIGRQSRYIAVLSQAEAELFRRQTGRSERFIIVPAGVDKTIPPPRKNPYAEFNERIAVYVGNIRGGRYKYPANGAGELDIVSQARLNLAWQERLNALGAQLRRKGIRLCFVGLGNVAQLDPAKVTVLGPVPNADIWDYHYFADVGIALAQGMPQYSECSKIYYYLRAGLPSVSETPIPTNSLITDTNHGLIVNYGDNEMMAEAVAEAARRQWDKNAAMRYMVKHHTWDARARLYDDILRQDFGLNDLSDSSAATPQSGRRAGV